MPGREEADGSGWRRVEDELPEEENGYIVFAGGYVSTAVWYKDDKEWSDDDVTHWMPFPAPPEV